MGNGKGMDNDKIVSIDIKMIDDSDRKRRPDPAVVKGMAEDIERRGLRSPVEVSKLPKGKWKLVAGGHRLAAYKLLGKSEINAFVVKGNADETALDEALENLVRSELTKLERAQSVWLVKKIFLQENPDRKNGGDRKSKYFQFPVSGIWSDTIALRSHLGKSTLAVAAEIGENIDAEAADSLWGSAVADNQTELLALTKYGPIIQRQIVGLIADGSVKTVAQGAAKATTATPAEPIVIEPEAQVKKVYSAFEKMTDDAKLMFAKLLKKEGFL